MDFNKEEIEKELLKQENNFPNKLNPQFLYHKGALDTLQGEKNELLKLLKNVEDIMNIHLKAIQDLGFKIEKQE